MFAFFHRLIGFLIGTNVYIALVAVALAAPGIVSFNPGYSWVNICFVFSSTMLAYNLQRYFKWRTGNMPVHLYRYAFGHSGWFSIILPPMVVSAVLFFFMRPFHQLLVGGITGLTGLYLFIHPKSGQLSGLRFIPFAKTLVVSFCWTALFIVACIPPQIFTFLHATWLYWILVFVQVWQSCVLFDLRDIETDRKHGVKTFANVFNQKQLLLLWTGIATLVIAFSFFPHHSYYVYALVLYLVGFILQLVCLFRPKMDGIWFTFLLDGSLIPMAAGNFLLLVMAA